VSVPGLRTLNGTHHGTRLTSIVLDVVKGGGHACCKGCQEPQVSVSDSTDVACVLLGKCHLRQCLPGGTWHM
jgi:hypothetical protein